MAHSWIFGFKDMNNLKKGRDLAFASKSLELSVTLINQY